MSNGLATARLRRPFPLGLRETVIQALPVVEDAVPRRPDTLDVLMGHARSASLADDFVSQHGRAVLDVRDSLYVAHGREKESARLWDEALATMLYATELARLARIPATAAGCAGLLHRAGEMCALRAVALAERDALLRLDEPTRSDLCTRHQVDFSQRLTREWRIPPMISTAMTSWRAFGRLDDLSKIAGVVYFSHLLAVELLHPEFCAPGLVGTVSRELGIETEHLQAMRLHDGTIRSLIESIGRSR